MMTTIEVYVKQRIDGKGYVEPIVFESEDDPKFIDGKVSILLKGEDTVALIHIPLNEILMIKEVFKREEPKVKKK